MNENGITSSRREALICVSLGGVRGIKRDNTERWRVSRATDVKPPSEADLTWLREQGFIDIKWQAGAPSSRVRLTPRGVEALKAAR